MAETAGFGMVVSVEEQVAKEQVVKGKCVACGCETSKVIWGRAMVKIFCCSEECLQKFFAPLSVVRPTLRRLDKPGEEECWLE